MLVDRLIWAFLLGQPIKQPQRYLFSRVRQQLPSFLANYRPQEIENQVVYVEHTQPQAVLQALEGQAQAKSRPP